MEKNDIIIGTVSALGTNGEGIVAAEGVTVFVPYLLPGERALSQKNAGMWTVLNFQKGVHL